MYFDKIKQHFKEGVSIHGANLGNVESATFDMLSESKHEVEYSAEELDIIRRFETKLIELYERAENGNSEETTIMPMEIKDGKVVLRDGKVCHRCYPTIETLTNISVCGVLASEWFGKPESEQEGALCTFLSKKFTSKNNTTNSFQQSALTPGLGKCFLYFDEKNPLMQSLMNIDFFEYQKIKKTEPEKLQELYSPGIIELFDKVIEPRSPFGKKMHDKETRLQYGWLAIPGGIPSQLINGLCIHSEINDELMSQIEEIRKMYPNATIFDENQNVIAEPLKTKSQKEHSI